MNIEDLQATPQQPPEKFHALQDIVGDILVALKAAEDIESMRASIAPILDKYRDTLGS